MTKRRDALAPARLAALRVHIEAAIEELSETPRDIVDLLATAPCDTDQACRAEESLVTACLEAGIAVGRPSLAGAIRTSLARLETTHPGHLVEVRVPPYAAVQIGIEGVNSAHTRGTPPHVVETDAATWLALASGRLTWADARATHRVRASGVHADLAALLPMGR